MNHDERNSLGFEGDSFIRDEIRRLVRRFNVELIIETGTYHGYTTKRLLEICPNVITIELNTLYLQLASRNLRGTSAKLVHGDSALVLKDHIPNHNRVLFYLDAHWEDNWPLLSELSAIQGIKPVIVIHDFKVPGRDFGFDSYKGQALDFEYIRPHIEAIYGAKGYDYHYNTEAEGAKQGVIYIYAAN